MIETLALFALVCLAFDWFDPLFAWRRYEALPSLGLRGSHHVHVPPEQLKTYTTLTHHLQVHSDVFLVVASLNGTPCFNSLYFWAGRDPLTYLNASSILGNYDHQAQIVAALQRASKPIIVVFTPEPNAVAKPEMPKPSPAGPLIRTIRDDYHEVDQIGTFQILEPNRTPNVHSPAR